MYKKIQAISVPFEQLLFSLKLFLFVAILLYMGMKISNMDNFFETQFVYFQTTANSTKGWLLFIAVSFVGLNWLFEALKWQEALKFHSKISLYQSFKSVLTGQAINLIIPANVGHMVGRIANIEESKEQKIRLTSLFFVCQVSQMFVTFVAFLIGLLFLHDKIAFFDFDWLLIFVLCLLGFILSVVLTWKFSHHALVREFLMGLKQVRTSQGVFILLYSVLRYLTFNTQFVLVFYFLGIKEDWLVLAMGISLVFMAKSLMPSFNFLSDIGIREFAALIFLPILGLSEPTIVAASLWIWMINIFLPSILGTFLVLKSKLGLLF